MAKLSANGASILARWKRTRDHNEDHYALRSDGVLLQRLVNRAQRYDYGWKVFRRGLRVDQDAIRAFDTKLTGLGYHREAV